ncbi:SPOR domain-containing protein [Deltaproteobacteria bacterium]|nr:SPOR domain-containing protein [Deltaproteobacteria bacterium]
MAEEKIDGLEGLDDFGDDFSEQLDSFMENEGEDESDSELDSFFEDLSTIDDLEDDEEAEIKDDKKAAETEDTVSYSSEEDQETDTAVESEEKPEEQQEKQKKKKAAFFDAFPLKSALISGTTGLLLGIITVAVLYYTAAPLETPEPEIVNELPPEPPTQVVKVSTPKPKKTVAKPKKTGAKAKAKQFNYYVQVVSCISQECVDDSRLQLKNLGYASQVRTSNKNSKIAELITTKILAKEDSAKFVSKINKSNPMAGHAFRKSEKNGFKISLGLFPDLKTANMVRTHLNQQFKDQLFFKIQSTTQKTQYKIVQIGGIKSKPEALKLRDQLKNNIPDFQEAFVKAVVMR